MLLLIRLLGTALAVAAAPLVLTPMVDRRRRAALRRLVPAACSVLDAHGIDYDLVWTSHGHPFLTQKGRLVDIATSVIREQTGIEPDISCTGGTSDGRFIARICREVVEIGPINETIHKLNERVAVADLERLAGIYRGILERLLVPAGAGR